MDFLASVDMRNHYSPEMHALKLPLPRGERTEERVGASWLAPAGTGRVQELVGGENRLNTPVLGGAKQNVLDNLGTGVGIDPGLRGFQGLSG